MIVGVLCSAILGGLTGALFTLGSEVAVLNLLLGYSGGGVLAVVAFLAMSLTSMDFDRRSQV